jgi:hypothetical protein
MNLPEEIQNYRRLQLAMHRGVPSRINERWVSRIIAREFHTFGESGADMYVDLYGHGIREKKLVDFAIKAEIEGCQDMANGFWKLAYSVQSGESAEAKRINKKRRRLMYLEEQKAKFGAFCPSHFVIEIEDLRRELGLNDDKYQN